MDGNGRWAKARGLERVVGHEEGARSVRDVVRAARQVGVRALTLYAFSEQNWARPKEEVDALMRLLHAYIVEERGEILDSQIRLTAIGEVSRLPALVRLALEALIDVSAKNRGMTLCLALSYGGREELVRAARNIALAVNAGTLRPEAVDESALESRLYTARMPPVDLLIRTSGEMRISNFLLWQLAYTEFYFTETPWPEFRRQEFLQAICTFQERERRFGKVSGQLIDEAS
jgi:undecaprenyl diphosphate synthase